jgi:SAM-dependent methyltransferase
MNYNRIYEYRFKNVNRNKKNIVWKEVSRFICKNYFADAQRILDPAGGLCEFINHAPVSEKWTIDLFENIKKYANEDIRVILGNNLKVEIPENYFDGVFVSNFLEHLHSQEEVAEFLTRMHSCLAPQGRIVIMGPNFKYVYREYFDFADHTVILSELGVAEHLYGAGFTIKYIYPKFLPLSFRSGGLLPVTRFTANLYLQTKLAWKILGKQFLIVAEKQ